jgi:TonB-dependent SusC/RagA subfamily outer membrane receptor
MDGVILSISEDLTTYFQTIDATNIDFIEVLKGPEAAAYGLQGAGGVILINTINKRKETTQINSKGLSSIYPKGYVKQIDFPAPDYEKKEIKKSPAPDLRSTIYWNGKAITDNAGKASIIFFTADANTIYTIKVFAVTLNGFVFSKTIEIKMQ